MLRVLDSEAGAVGDSGGFGAARSVHVSNILAKLHAASRTEAAAIAYRAGLTVEDS